MHTTNYQTTARRVVARGNQLILKRSFYKRIVCVCVCVCVFTQNFRIRKFMGCFSHNFLIFNTLTHIRRLLEVSHYANIKIFLLSIKFAVIFHSLNGVTLIIY